MNKMFAIVGMCGAGKSIASEYLEKKGWSKIYFGGVTMKKLQEEGLAITPENEKMMRNCLRQELGMAAYAKILIPEIKEAIKHNNVVLDGVYSWDEVKELSNAFGDNITIISIVVDKHLRYERLKIREVRPLTEEEANDRDISEIENLAKGGPIGYADYYIFNNGTIEEYYERLEEIIRKKDNNEKND